MSDVDEFSERFWECPHANFFFKEWRFYCRTCGKSEEECLGKEVMTRSHVYYYKENKNV